MTKPTIFVLANLLKLVLQKKDIKYHLAIPMVVRVACTLFKLIYGTSLLICNESFVVGRSIVSLMLWEVVQAINIALRLEILWPTGDKLLEIEANFCQLRGLPRVIGAIDDTHVTISKPKFGPTDYYYFKSGGYRLNYQAIVDSKKWFIDLFLGMPSSTNDARCLSWLCFYWKGMQGTL